MKPSAVTQPHVRKTRQFFAVIGFFLIGKTSRSFSYKTPAWSPITCTTILLHGRKILISNRRYEKHRRSKKPCGFLAE